MYWLGSTTTTKETIPMGPFILVVIPTDLYQGVTGPPFVPLPLLLYYINTQLVVSHTPSILGTQPDSSSYINTIIIANRGNYIIPQAGGCGSEICPFLYLFSNVLHLLIPYENFKYFSIDTNFKYFSI